MEDNQFSTIMTLDYTDKKKELTIRSKYKTFVEETRHEVTDELNETIGADFPSEEFESLSGFVFGLFGKVPVKYEKISWNEYEFIIHDMEGHRINMVKISKNEDSEEVNEE